MEETEGEETLEETNVVRLSWVKMFSVGKVLGKTSWKERYLRLINNGDLCVFKNEKSKKKAHWKINVAGSRVRENDLKVIDNCIEIENDKYLFLFTTKDRVELVEWLRSLDKAGGYVHKHSNFVYTPQIYSEKKHSKYFRKLTKFCHEKMKKRGERTEPEEPKVLLEEQPHPKKRLRCGPFKKTVFNIPFHKVEVQSVVSHIDSVVMLYLCKYKGRRVLLKLFRTYEISNQETFQRLVEVQKLAKDARHPNLLHFHGCILDEPRVGFVIDHPSINMGEYAIDIVDYLGYKSNDTEEDGSIQRTVSIEQKIRILKNVSEVMRYLSTKNISHGRLVWREFFFNSKLVPKLGDIGILNKVFGKQLVSVDHRNLDQFIESPEISLGLVPRKYPPNEKSDVFSFGIMMYELITEDFSPFSFVDERYFKDDILNMKIALNPTCRPKIDEFVEKNRDSFLTSSSEGTANFLSVVDLMKVCWRENPEERPSFSDCVMELERYLALDVHSEEIMEIRKDFADRKEYILKVLNEEKPIGIVEMKFSSGLSLFCFRSFL